MPHAVRVAAAASAVGMYGADERPFNMAIDPIVSSDLASLPTSPSRSRVGVAALSLGRDDPASSLAVMSENDPLLGGGDAGKQRRKKPFYRARPLWIVPFAVLASIARGMTIAPRVEVFTQLSCNAVHGHQPIDYNHTRARELFTLTPHSLDSAGDSAPELLFHTLEDSEGDDGDGDDDDDPLRIPTKRCISDPAVQAGAARLQTIMTTTMGLLSALTTGWWGHFGERHGRTRVLAVATLGLLLTDLIFVLVSLPGSPLAAHGHKLLIIAPVVEGLLGGWSTLQGAASAYISDCTSDGSRSHIFSRFMGVFYFGFALGPMLGAWFIAHPPPLAFLLPASEARSAGHTVTPVFWVAVMFALANFFLALFVFPESLGKEKREARRVAEAAAAVELEVQGSKSSNGGVLALLKGLLVPLMVFAPKKRATKKDWNMTFLALALFGYLLSSGIFSLKYLYAEHVFGWEAEQLSYYITLVGGARAVHLLFIMPFIIAVCKPKPKAAAAAQQSSTPAGKKPKPTKAQVAAEMTFDLRISRISYAVDLLSHTLVALSSTAPTAAAQAAFVCFTLLSCFGSGIVPSVQSLALCIVQADAMEDERLGTVSSPAGAATGSLFGAFAVLQATGQMVLGPMIFGLVYSTTVACFPKGIFALAASILVVSLALLMLVQPRLGGALEQKKPRKGSSRAWAESEMERGRSRVSKDLTGGVADGSPGSSSGSVPKDGWASTSY